jgi:hypothetical protein
MMSIDRVFLESFILATVNVLAAYMAAFTYRLNWTGVIFVMVAVSLLAGYLAHVFSGKTDMRSVKMLLSDATSFLTVAAMSSLAVLVILTMRFNFPEALGIALLSGGLSTFVRSVIRDL